MGFTGLGDREWILLMEKGTGKVMEEAEFSTFFVSVTQVHCMNVPLSNMGKRKNEIVFLSPSTKRLSY